MFIHSHEHRTTLVWIYSADPDHYPRHVRSTQSPTDGSIMVLNAFASVTFIANELIQLILYYERIQELAKMPSLRDMTRRPSLQ